MKTLVQNTFRFFICMCSMCTLLVTSQMSSWYRNFSQACYNITTLTSAITCETCPHNSAKKCNIKQSVNIIFYITPQNKSRANRSAGIGGQRLQPLSPMWLHKLMLQCYRTHNNKFKYCLSYCYMNRTKKLNTCTQNVCLYISNYFIVVISYTPLSIMNCNSHSFWKAQ
jgi:hypothetical protein